MDYRDDLLRRAEERRRVAEKLLAEASGLEEAAGQISDPEEEQAEMGETQPDVIRPPKKLGYRR